jgi:hypothetical protein
MRITVIVHPNSKIPRVEKDSSGNMHIYVRQPAKEGKANTAVIQTLADTYDIPKTFIKQISGEKARVKTFELATRN